MNHETVIMLSLTVAFLNYWGLTVKQFIVIMTLDKEVMR